MNLKVRVAVYALTLSFAAFAKLVTDEGYTDTAVIPTKGDVPTHGFGSTKHEDGTPVRLGEKTTPVRAVQLAAAHINAEEIRFRDSLPNVALTQGEYDVYMDFVYQYGIGNWRTSSMRADLLAKRYRQACNDLLKYRYSAGYDCSTPGNKRCAGVWVRQQQRHARCIAEQSA
ncbi:MAG: lysozyme [Pseudomonadota bacterium]